MLVKQRKTKNVDATGLQETKRCVSIIHRGSFFLFLLFLFFFFLFSLRTTAERVFMCWSLKLALHFFL